jgi:hypothetical protein
LAELGAGEHANGGGLVGEPARNASVAALPAKHPARLLGMSMPEGEVLGRELAVAGLAGSRMRACGRSSGVSSVRPCAWLLGAKPSYSRDGFVTTSRPAASIVVRMAGGEHH